ncbi:MAG: response regulator transcription factor [Saprospiraceae bacterium]|nr:response regulator transcription factor [Saprospiraceae bacterium]
MGKKAQILMVDDERQFSSMTREYLEARGLDVVLEHNGISGLETFKAMPFDLCILDVKMPIKDGFTLAEELRKLKEQIPIIFLTGELEKEQRIRGLKLGADDYVTKPFSMEELFLRVQNILRRVDFREEKTVNRELFRLGNFEFDPTSRELKLATKTFKLTAIESQLLRLLCLHENEVLERELALKRIWGDDDFIRGRSLNVYVSKLRQYLILDPRIEIMNVHGVGYKIVVV